MTNQLMASRFLKNAAITVESICINLEMPAEDALLVHSKDLSSDLRCVH